ncbi:cryptochrome/photolyase family protein [Natrarchaeobius chitinivorans]|uniref:Deoxyribodipyrimidine photo-lyase n=1 Tax=Natrarchaeobius chitinivorans TaxID=1679083 RepID=A0A3N6LVH6_NATCH|nr:deoxyribodipyrimidine photo-lyase [Natrarchaeobius chitinivorans]RQG94458.1 deoxyribodipyrimidine photo-lyase [Natrarchaeobius chitinivorans]
MNVHWHRRDLRATDNRSLDAAASEGMTLPVFVFDPEILEFASPPRVAFMLESLAELRAWYRERGSDLVVATGDPRDEIPRIAREHGADCVTWNLDYSGLADDRDEAVRKALGGAGIDVESYDDALLHEPGSITTQKGETYAVYSYFWRKWRDRETESPAPEPPADRLADVSSGPLPSLADLGFDDPEADVPDGGMDAARRRLETFCAGPVYRYADRRDEPAADATSGLSAHLKWGTVGIRTVDEALERAKDDAPDEAAIESCEEFASQLAWREFYAHVLDANPSVVTQNYRSYEHRIRWRTDPDALQAWKDGETGYPIVDAGMRQLRSEAFVHNRVRMIVASFLTKDLLLDWRKGYAWFREKLVDHDTANDVGGWQWAAGTGTDAQPYFRIFNPMTQGERYDPDAEYIHEHVPELEEAPPEAIHDWPDLEPEERAAVAPAYPAPIVDHAECREAAIEMFETARGDE